MKPIRFLSLAQDELSTSLQYYAEQENGLGERGLSKIEVALDRTKQFSEAFPLIAPDIRKKLLSYFPYGILYSVQHSEIIIIAIMHLYPALEYWRNILPDGRHLEDESHLVAVFGVNYPRDNCGTPC